MVEPNKEDQKGKKKKLKREKVFSQYILSLDKQMPEYNK